MPGCGTAGGIPFRDSRPPVLGRRFPRLRQFLRDLRYFICVLALALWAGPSLADLVEDFIESNPELVESTLSEVLDVLTLRNDELDKTREDAQGKLKTKTKSFLEGKLKDKFNVKAGIKSWLTGGAPPSAGMDAILKRINDALNAHRQSTGGRPGMCELAAINQASSLAFDASNIRLGRGFTEIWYDLVTSGIEGAPVLVEKLVEETASAALETLKKEITSKIKAGMKKEGAEVFEWTKDTGDCTVSISVVWNKDKEKYAFMIRGECGCKAVAVEPLGRGGRISLKSFLVSGSGTVSGGLDAKDPSKPKIAISAGTPRYSVKTDCDCQVQEDPPPKLDPKLEKLPLIEGQIQKRPVTGVCPACEALLRTLYETADRINRMTEHMNDIAREVNADTVPSLERDNRISQWKRLEAQRVALEQSHSTTFIALDRCINRECKGSGPFYLERAELLSSQRTDCEPCLPLMRAANEAIDLHNAKAKELNDISDTVQLGTTEGNEQFRIWQRLRAEIKPLRESADEKIKALADCQNNQCKGPPDIRIKLRRIISGTCLPCKPIEQRHNAVIDQLNQTIVEREKLNREYLSDLPDWKNLGDAEASSAISRQKERYLDPLDALARKQDDLEAQADALRKELEDCVRTKCVTVEVISVRGIVGHNPLDALDPLGEDAARHHRGGSGAGSGTPPAAAVFSTAPGAYNGSGGCGVGPTNLSQAAGTATLNPLGAAGAVPFNILNANTARSVSTNLFILGAFGHTCEMRNGLPASFLLYCWRTSNPAINCSENFN